VLAHVKAVQVLDHHRQPRSGTHRWAQTANPLRPRTARRTH